MRPWSEGRGWHRDVAKASGSPAGLGGGGCVPRSQDGQQGFTTAMVSSAQEELKWPHHRLPSLGTIQLWLWQGLEEVFKGEIEEVCNLAFSTVRHFVFFKNGKKAIIYYRKHLSGDRGKYN